MVRVGHYRRYLLYLIVFLSLLSAAPAPAAGYFLTADFSHALGVLIACLGQALRLWAWASNSTAPGLRIHGPYAFIRHPLYLGNYLIALGVVVAFNAVLVYLIVLPSLALLYWKVTAEEEQRLERKWGVAHAEYRAEVPRFLPLRGRTLRETAAVPFDWRRALGKERESIFAVAAGFIVLDSYKEIVAFGFESALKDMQIDLLCLLLVALVAAVVYLGKEKKSEGARFRSS